MSIQFVLSKEARKEVHDFHNSKESLLNQTGQLRYGINNKISELVVEAMTIGFYPSKAGLEDLKDDIDEAAHEAATSHLNDLPEPTIPMYEAGNYKKGHITLQGLRISIENPQGSTRKGVDKDGKEWSRVMSHHYGYVKGSLGADGDHVDVYVGDTPESEDVFVVNQIFPDTLKFDEHKVMLGFTTLDSAVKAYKSNFTKDWKGLGSVTEITMEEFKEHLKKDKVTKPILNDKSVHYGTEDLKVYKPPVVRYATKKDLPKLIELWKTLVSETNYLRNDIVESNKVSFETNKFNEMSKEPNKYFVLDLDGLIVGAIRCTVVKYKSEASFGLGVLAKHQGRGYGALLINTLISSLKEDGISLLYLYVNTENVRAIGLYNKLGFKPNGKLLEIGKEKLLEMDMQLGSTKPKSSIYAKSLKEIDFLSLVRGTFKLGFGNENMIDPYLNGRNVNTLEFKHEQRHRVGNVFQDTFDNTMRELGWSESKPVDKSWVGFDLDGTLAEYDGWKGIEFIGKPIPSMVDRVKQYLSDGQNVKIFTARACDDEAIPFVKEWLTVHGLGELEITNVKDFHMVKLYDDRCVQVVENTGELVGLGK